MIGRNKDRTVFILGAGASYGDTLVHEYDKTETTKGIPLTEHFFRSEYLEGEDVKANYRDLIEYISANWNNYWPFGDQRWRYLSVEEVFTSLAIENEFAPHDSDLKSHTQLLLNSLKRYIRKVMGKNSLNRHGRFTRQLVQNLQTQDSIITFNYDLLIDEAFLRGKPYEKPLHYEKFSSNLLGRSLFELSARTFEHDQGLFLKMHGSLNWFLCTNSYCPNSAQPRILTDCVQSLAESEYGVDRVCEYCAGSLTPYLIPPLLNKRILRDKVSRNIWSNALSEVQSASKIVLIGYSFPPTDFYAAWLFRSALTKLRACKVWVVNPLNEPNSAEVDTDKKAKHEASQAEFRSRMLNIIRDPICRYVKFEQIGEVLDDVRAAD